MPCRMFASVQVMRPFRHKKLQMRRFGKGPSLASRRMGLVRAWRRQIYGASLVAVLIPAAIIAVLFVPRIRAWLSEVGQLHAKPSNPQTGQNICHAIEILIKSGSDDDRRSLEITARQRLAGGLVQPFSNFCFAPYFIWMPSPVSRL